jgi:hypothetical protein
MDNETNKLTQELNCINKCSECLQQAPLLDSVERNKHIKNCDESIVRCYLDIIMNDVKTKYNIK